MPQKAKEVRFDDKARKSLCEGIKMLTDTISVTFGPNGRYRVKDMQFKDPFAYMGASIGKEVASKMKETCGDGTTTSLLLLNSLVTQGVKQIAAGASPVFIKRGMEKTASAIVEQLEKNALLVKSHADIEEIATSAASGQKEVGEWIAKAFEKVGKSGVILIEEGKRLETTLEIIEGLQFDSGTLSGYFCSNRETTTCELSNPLILVTDKKITSIQEILPLLQAVGAAGQKLILIAEDVEGDALSTLVLNHLHNNLKVCAVKAPGYGDNRKALLQEIALLTGACLITKEEGIALKETEITMLGKAKKAIMTKDLTTLIGGKGKFSREIAVIRIGATTESELKAKKKHFEEVISSTKAALEEGIVIGGGMALLRASKEVEKTLQLPEMEKGGKQTVLKACEAPFRQLVQNSRKDGSIFLEDVLSQQDSFGFNVETGQIEDLLKAKVRDPLKIVRTGFLSALSAASHILLTECLIGPTEEDS